MTINVSLRAYFAHHHTIEITAFDYFVLWSETGDAGFLALATQAAQFAADCRAAVRMAVAA